MRDGSLTVIGTGIQLSQLSFEARAALENADKVLYLVADPLTRTWITQANRKAEALDKYYGKGKDRLLAYHEMVERILDGVREGLDVCVAFYGHPGIFVHPSHDAIRLARLEGFKAKMLPAISALDCLFADLGINPAIDGYQSYEATDFLVHRRHVDTRSCLVLWQVGLVGQLDAGKKSKASNVAILVNALEKLYKCDHEMVIYEAAQYPLCDPIINRMPLAYVGQAHLTRASTLFVPPGRRACADLAMLRRLRIPLLKRGP